MNDVLPKPFTKEGLLQMLEKHLGHLKKQPSAMDAMGAPPQPLAHVAAKNSMKSEDSPATSPATVSNWNSPGNNLGVSPAASNDEYMNSIQAAGHPPGPYQIPPGMAPPIGFGTSPQGPIPRALPPGVQAPGHVHRRAISEISGGPGDTGPDIKRQQMFHAGPPPGIAAGMPQHMGPPQAMHHQPIGQAIPGPLNPMQRRPG